MDFHLNLNTEPVRRAYSVDPIYLESTDTVRKALHRMREKTTGAVLICDEGLLVGIFTERDAMKMMASGHDFDAPLKEFMTTMPVSLSAEDTVGKAIAKMSYGGYRRLPIVDSDGRCQGVLKTSGILHYLVEHFPKVIYNLPPTPHHATQNREGA